MSAPTQHRATSGQNVEVKVPDSCAHAVRDCDYLRDVSSSLFAAAKAALLSGPDAHPQIEAIAAIGLEARLNAIANRLERLEKLAGSRS